MCRMKVFHANMQRSLALLMRSSQEAHCPIAVTSGNWVQHLPFPALVLPLLHRCCRGSSVLQKMTVTGNSAWWGSYRNHHSPGLLANQWWRGPDCRLRPTKKRIIQKNHLMFSLFNLSLSNSKWWLYLIEMSGWMSGNAGEKLHCFPGGSRWLLHQRWPPLEVYRRSSWSLAYKHLVRVVLCPH